MTANTHDFKMVDTSLKLANEQAATSPALAAALAEDEAGRKARMLSAEVLRATFPWTDDEAIARVHKRMEEKPDICADDVLLLCALGSAAKRGGWQDAGLYALSKQLMDIGNKHTDMFLTADPGKRERGNLLHGALFVAVGLLIERQIVNDQELTQTLREALENMTGKPSQ